MSVVSGWYETEGGVDVFDFEGDFETHEDVAAYMYINFAPECIGVDMEIEGELSNGHSIDVMSVTAQLEWLSEELLSEEHPLP